MRFFICGSALRGQPDHGNLQDAEFLGVARTAPRYRLHSVDNQHPGIYEVAEGGIAIAGELYELTNDQHAHLISTEPPNLYEAPIELDDGTHVSAMIYPRDLIGKLGWPDISHHGGWAAFKAAEPSAEMSAELSSSTAAIGAFAAGAVATGASATGALAIGALAVIAFAAGAVSVGVLAVRHLRVLDARLERLEIGELTVERLTILERTEVPPAT